MRFASSLNGMVFTDAFFAYRYFVNKDADFNEEMSKLAMELMHNSFIEDSAVSPRSAKSSQRSSPSDCMMMECDHELVPLKYIKGFEGYKQQRCILCNGPTTWCCRDCTAGPFALIPICPKETLSKRGKDKGKVVKHGCLARHRANPALIPQRRKSAKRVRRAPATEGTQSAEEDDMCGDAEEE